MRKAYIRESFDADFWKTEIDILHSIAVSKMLGVEGFVATKRRRILEGHGDLRQKAMELLSTVWQALDEKQDVFLDHVTPIAMNIAASDNKALAEAGVRLVVTLFERDFKVRLRVRMRARARVCACLCVCVCGCV